MADGSKRPARDARDERDEDGWSVLDWAAGRGDLAEVTRLLDAGADPGARTPDGRTPQEIALAAGHLEVARLLRDARQATGEQLPDEAWRPYCRAYSLGDLRRYPGWPQPRDQAGQQPAGQDVARHDVPDQDPADQELADQELADDAIVFLHDDLTVTRSAWPGEDLLYRGAGEGWAEYCRQSLDFAVPSDFDLVPAAAGGDVAPR
jgi:hypothetical protein